MLTCVAPNLHQWFQQSLVRPDLLLCPQADANLACIPCSIAAAPASFQMVIRQREKAGRLELPPPALRSPHASLQHYANLDQHHQALADLSYLSHSHRFMCSSPLLRVVTGVWKL